MSGGAGDAEAAAPVRHASYDLLRWVAIAAVVVIHVTVRAVVLAPGSWPTLANAVARFGIPAFVFITGALVWSRPVPPGGLGQYARRRIATVFVPYVLWSAVYLVVGGAVSARELLTFDGLRTLGLSLLHGSAEYHLYFVPLILCVYVLAPLAGPVVRRAPAAAFLILCVVSVFAAIPVAASGVGEVWRWVPRLIGWIPLAALGVWYEQDARTSERFGKLAWVVALVGLVVGAAYFSGTIQRMVLPGDTVLAVAVRGLVGLAALSAAIVGIAALCERACDEFPPLASRASASAPLVFGVYLIHPRVLHYLNLALHESGIGVRPLWFPYTLGATVLVLGTSAGVTWLLARTRWTAWAVGAKAAR